MALVVKNLLANAGNVRDGGLGRKDPLEEDKATHLGFLALRKNPHGQESLVGCSLWSLTESDTTEAT